MWPATGIKLLCSKCDSYHRVGECKMIDDNGYDTQQGIKPMSVKELRFVVNVNEEIIITFEGNELIIKSSDGDGFFALSIDEAHLLMLYLQERLK